MNKDCTNCDNKTREDYNYCPDCGHEMKEITVNDVDFPLRMRKELFLNVNNIVSRKTGLENPPNPKFDNERRIDLVIEISKDGAVRVVGGDIGL